MMASPISESARPNPISIAVDTPYLASLTMVTIACVRPAPSETAVSRISGATPRRAEMVRPAIMGDMSNTWPTTMAAGEKSRPSPPSGPSRESVMNTSSPTNTVGMLNSVCMTFTSIDFPRKL